MAQSDTTALLDRAEIRDEATANKYLDLATEAEQRGDRMGVIDALEAAFVADPDNPTTCFRLAYHLDLVGEEDEALHLYEQCAQRPSPHINALLNLAVLYEDRQHYAKAERCVKQVLSTNPNHRRARLFIKDILASQQMIIEEEPQSGMDSQHVMLDTPVTDFELSVRTRNALRKMEIRTLGDLLRVTEADLRSYKNVGDSSLEEIKAMLAQRGLKLGQALEQQQSAVKQQVIDKLRTDGGNEELLERSVGELQLSVRARKALSLLNINMLSDLCMRTEAELMGVKNFGMTSLLEIKEKLTDIGLSLRQLDA
jgi:DNA-directed RNA polymerase subunit alpha